MASAEMVELLSHIFGRVDEKAMIRNQYNRIPLPSQNTIRERNTENQDGIK